MLTSLIIVYGNSPQSLGDRDREYGEVRPYVKN